MELKKGQESLCGDSIVLKPITEEYLKKLQGSLKGKGALKMLLNEHLIEVQRNR
jgi:hypothetical protein